MSIAIISGTRPQFIKLSPLIRYMDGLKIDFIHISTGQHYDDNLSTKLIEDLGIPQPDYNLRVGSSSHAVQTANMMMKLETIFISENIDTVIVIGDTNSTLAGGIVASKLQINLIHLESGLRSYDMRMPEEKNRIMVDHISDMLFASGVGMENLIAEGIEKEKIFNVGDLIVDVLENAKIKLSGDLDDDYVLVTFHREENEALVTDFVQLLKESPIQIKYVFHPRTEKLLKQEGLWCVLQDLDHVELLPPQLYSDFIQLVVNAKGIMTDSGGLQKEAFILKKPCITLRRSTEWVETVEKEVNRLFEAYEIQEVLDSLNDICDGSFTVDADHDYGENVSLKIIKLLDYHSLIQVGGTIV